MEHYSYSRAKTTVCRNEISEKKHPCAVRLPMNEIQVKVNQFLRTEGAGREDYSGIRTKGH